MFTNKIRHAPAFYSYSFAATKPRQHTAPGRDALEGPAIFSAASLSTLPGQIVMSQTTVTFSLQGHTVLSTGAAHGTGVGIAKATAGQGATVIIKDFYAKITSAGADELKQQGLSDTALVFDVIDNGGANAF